MIMEDSFNTFLTDRYPPDAKRGTSGVIRASLGEKIVRVLKDPTAGDKNLRFYVKKHKFELLHLPSLGVQQALVVPVEQTSQVNHCQN